MQKKAWDLRYYFVRKNMSFWLIVFQNIFGAVEKTMFLSEVLEKMKEAPFTLEIRTFNKYNKSGGKTVIYEDAELMRPPKKKGLVRLSDPTPFKNPYHFENRTRNIKLDGVIKKMHIIFIIRFNGFLVTF